MQGEGKARWVTGLSAPPRCNPSLGGCNHPLPFVRMKSGKVGLPNYTHLALSFLLRPSPAAPATGYGYPTDKGAGGRGLGVPKQGHSPAHGAFISSPPPVEQR